MTLIMWPGVGIEADLLILQHVLGKDTSSFRPLGDGGTVKPGVIGNGRVMVPPYSRVHAVAVTNIIEPMEDDGYFFTVGNEGGRYVANLRFKGQAWQGSSRSHVAEAICLAALRSKGFEVKVG